MSEKAATAAQKIEAMLEMMWGKSRPLIEERVLTLRSARQMLGEGSLDRITRKDAESAAHKLAGVLGTFGLPQGSAVASKIEALMAQDEGINAQQQQSLDSWLNELESQIASKGR